MHESEGPRVNIIGSTAAWIQDGDYGYKSSADGSLDDDATDVIEFAGRACYQSFDKPNPSTRSNDAYLANLIRQQHFSVLEHASVTFYITGVSRNFTHELIRHRHLSYSELSQRYVDPGKKELSFVRPPNGKGVNWGVVAGRAAIDYDTTSNLLADHADLSKKQLRESARAVLPGGTETRIVVTGNYRAWRDFLFKRVVSAADAEMYRVATMIMGRLKEHSPSVFGDLTIDENGDINSDTDGLALRMENSRLEVEAEACRGKSECRCSCA